MAITQSFNYLNISNNLDEIVLLESIGISIIFIDLEILGKVQRQSKENSFISDHTINDLIRVKKITKKSQVLVRINSIHQGSSKEIFDVMSCQPDIIMLPFIQTIDQVRFFLDEVDKNTVFLKRPIKKMLLIETLFSVKNIKEILKFKSRFDFVHIGLNDLNIELKNNFMFNYTISSDFQNMINELNNHSVPFGVGGVSCFNCGLISPKLILAKHIQWGSSFAIISKEFRKKYDPLKPEIIINEFNILKKTYNDLVNLDKSQLNLLIQEFEEAIHNISLKN
jgi:hypothetical protein